MNLRFERCKISDLETLIKIGKETFVAAFEKDNDPEDFQDYIEKAFHPKKIKTELTNENSMFYFVYEGNLLVGYYKLNIGEAQTDVQDSEALELERIYVVKGHQGKKIGSHMLKKVVELTQALQKKYVWLGVWEHNTRAIHFYQRLGFQKFGEHPYYIGTDKQTDWLLRLDVQ